MKPRIFIGSSTESKEIAKKVQRILENEYICEVWYNDFFELGECTYHNLIKKSISFDYAIFIGGKDDRVFRISKKTEKYAPRDNIYLEFGLYVGILSYARCFFLIQKGCSIASDLLGINVLLYEEKQDIQEIVLNINAKIKQEQKLNRIGLLPSTSLAIGYFENFLKPISKAVLGLKDIKVDSNIYQVQSNEKVLEIVIPENTEEDLRSWSELFFESNSVFKTYIDTSIRNLGVNIDCNALEKDNKIKIIDIPVTLSSAYKSVELVLAVDYVGNTKLLQLAKEKELKNFISTLNNLIKTDSFAKQIVTIKQYKGM